MRKLAFAYAKTKAGADQLRGSADQLHGNLAFDQGIFAT